MEAALRRPITSAAVSPSRLLTASMSLPQQTGARPALALQGLQHLCPPNICLAGSCVCSQCRCTQRYTLRSVQPISPAARCSMSDIWATCIKAKCTFCAALTAAPPAAPPTGPGHQAHAPCRASAPGRSPAAPTAPAATLPLRRRLPNGAWQHLHAESSSLTPRCTVSITCYTMDDLQLNGYT